MLPKQLLSVSILLMIFSGSIIAQDSPDKKMSDHKSGHIMKLPSDLNWGEGPASLPKGAQIVVLEGDPSKEGPFTMRAKIPANYKIPPHTHPAVEHVTVLKGSCYMGMGKMIDESKAANLTEGSFMAINPGTEHFFYTKEEVEIQLHGIGPWGITYVNPADDPRNMTNK
jgi:quercetin dioxygenase-like cupin family protein